MIQSIRIFDFELEDAQCTSSLFFGGDPKSPWIFENITVRKFTGPFQILTRSNTYLKDYNVYSSFGQLVEVQVGGEETEIVFKDCVIYNLNGAIGHNWEGGVMRLENVYINML